MEVVLLKKKFPVMSPMSSMNVMNAMYAMIPMDKIKPFSNNMGLVM